MDDPNDPLVKALTEEPLPDRPYWPGQFSQRLRRGEISRVRPARLPVAPVRRRGATIRAISALAIVVCLVGGYFFLHGESGPGAPSPSPSSSAPGRPNLSPAPSPISSLGPTVRIGLSLPLTTNPSDGPDAIRDGALLAIKAANASHQIPGISLVPVILDDTSPGNDDLAKGESDMRDLVADSTVVGVIGPYQSYVAAGQIPISNAAGLLQCSPDTSAPDLTKGPQAQQLRVTNPGRIAFLRLAPTDDDVGSGLADFAFQTLHARRAFVFDDGAGYGVTLADTFAARFETIGGTIAGRETTAQGVTDYSAVLNLAFAAHPDVVLYGGVNAYGGIAGSGAGAVRRQMAASGLGAIPLIGGDGLKDTDQTGASLADIAGVAAAGTYSADLVPPDYPGKAAFSAAFKAEYGRAPSPDAGPGYACAQVLIQAIAAAAAAPALTRDGVRAAGADSSATFHTILGALRFDSAGDLIAPGIGMDTIDLKANGGKGGWVVVPGTIALP
jgi:branched-chain amino acid transport system substrate-binding protein